MQTPEDRVEEFIRQNAGDSDAVPLAFHPGQFRTDMAKCLREAAAEREACAKMMEERAKELSREGFIEEGHVLNDFASAIRERGNSS